MDVRATHQKSGAQNGAGIGDGAREGETEWLAQWNCLLTLLHLGPIFVLSIQLPPQSRQAHTEEPESTTLSS